MTRKTKMLTLVCSIALVLCIGVVGVFAATSQSAGVTTSVSFTATDVVGTFKITGTKGGTAIADIDGDTAGDQSEINLSFGAGDASDLQKTIKIANQTFATTPTPIVYTFTTTCSSQHAQYKFACTPSTATNVNVTYSHSLNGTNVGTSATYSNTALPDPGTGNSNTIVSTITVTVKDAGKNASFALTGSSLVIKLADTSVTL